MTGRRRRRDVVARLPQARRALGFAEQVHAGQRRSSDGAPFIEHPIEVGWLLYRAGAPDHVIAAGILHDVLEKTAVTRAAVSSRFGSCIASLVSAVSEEEGIAGYAERKAALRQQVAAAGPEALNIFAADKVSKVRELRDAIAAAARTGQSLKPSLMPPRRLVHLRRCLGMLEECLGEVSLVKLLKIELEALGRDLEADTAIPAVA